MKNYLIILSVSFLFLISGCVSNNSSNTTILKSVYEHESFQIEENITQ